MGDLYQADYKPYYSKSWALVIGINDYEHANPLSYARQDAEDFASVLQDLGFPADGIELITDRHASRERIMSSYLAYATPEGCPDDRIIVFFAGHGVTRAGYRGPVGYLVPADGDRDEAASLIRLDDLTRNADLIPAKHMLFIFDACFSGLVFKRAIYPRPQRFLSEMLQRRSRQAISAGKADEVVADEGGPDGHNSIFTGYLLEALRGQAATATGVLTANGVMHYVYESIAEDPRAEQTPHYGHLEGDGDLILAAPNQAPLTISPPDTIIETSPEMPGPPVVASPTPPALTFAERSGYAVPDQPSFGRNTYSAKLGNVDFGEVWQEATALSWLAVVIEPLSDAPVSINVADEANRLSQYTPEGVEPYQRFLPPRELMTTIDSVILFDKLRYDSQYWRQYVRIEKAGNIEFCDSFYSYLRHLDISAFRYVQLIGIVWQVLFFAKLILAESGYEHGVRVLVNLVGTKDTILADFADEPGANGKRWADPGRPDPLRMESPLLDLKCPNTNLQMEYRLVMAGLDPSGSRQVINDLASQLGLAYNHQSEPRCFNYKTDVFPWRTFFRLRQTHS